ncbi:hypothetical protein M426DRAFT_323928 [Hypoxylon sp. CI-4A]|nr:hypothetical protein M426DRAFT_323928 [Hypoxylon sp. CI-4A]
MKVPTIHAADAALLLSLLATPLPTAAMFRCNQVVASGQRFDLIELGGPHSVVTSRIIGDVPHNTTYTLDICRPLKKKGKELCTNGSKVCAIKRINDTFEKAIPIAGDLAERGGSSLDPEITLLGDSESDAESQEKGLLLVLKGGKDKTDSGQDRPQRAVIKFLCDDTRNGTEGEYDPADDKYEPGDDDSDPIKARTNPLLYRAEDDDNGDDDDDDDGGDNGGDGDGGDAFPKEVQLGLQNDPSLIFDGYAPLDENSNIDVLRLTWKSKYACANRDGGSDEKPSSHWGFFTWLVILVFLGTAAYLIFGSWLNYNRYGARGWDLIPHGDTIRDIPYLLKDWTRRVLNTVQGSGSRGGYSAV